MFLKGLNVSRYLNCVAAQPRPWKQRRWRPWIHHPRISDTFVKRKSSERYLSEQLWFNKGGGGGMRQYEGKNTACEARSFF
jgi:hypothetical protein